MTRLDPLTQSVTAPVQQAPGRPVQAPASSVPPAEPLTRFVAAVDRAQDLTTLEAGYAAVRLRGRLTNNLQGLSELDMRLSGAAEGLRGTQAAHAPSDGEEATKARIAELRGAASALNVAISGARSDVASVLRQMQGELLAAMEALETGSSGKRSPLHEGSAAGTSGNGELLVRQAAALRARAARL
ncbi:hypothetical protein FQV27_09865 [Paracoccus aurantiacus]|uniref:Uncharacterized protein n=1 Tax=Paracoccus aurantiacus TaxID=2599412 RepID=A0A5C6S449_9RHOB|nr:hypothetical protein [Paracoccus aurantiacus]TXB69256.1 hypothetical protein FQV27_09865 [Paracoccus aurantiacus]